MEGLNSQLEGEDNLIAAARQIVRALGSQKNLTDDAKKVLADLGAQLSNITVISEDKDDDDGNEEEQEEDISVLEAHLNTVQEKISNWEADHSMIWDLGPDEAAEYMNATLDTQKLTARLQDFCNGGPDDDNNRGRELLRRAYDVLQMAMARLEQEFTHLLVQNQLPFDRELASFRSSEDDGIDFSSVVSAGDDSGFDDPIARDSVSRTWEENNIMDLVHPDSVPDLRDIANLMFVSGYGHECSQAYITVRRDALDECLFNLDMERLSIEDVLRLEWGSLNSKIKKWVRALKVFVRVYLASERFLSDQIFGQLGTTTYFIEASKASMLQLLNFGEAISIGPHKPEKLFPILDMYEIIADVIPDIDSLYPGDSGSCVRTDCHELQYRLGDSVRAAFLEFENAIATSTSTNPFAGGGIHHLTRYVMNYLNTLTDYQNSLNSLLKDQERVQHPVVMSPDISPSREEDFVDSSSPTDDVSSMALHFRSVTSILECNLDVKARLYKDVSLQHVFMMNNIHYMAQKVKNNSALRHIFGDEWIRKRNWKFQQHELYYERATWSSVLSMLRDEGNSHPNATSRSQLRDMIRNFYAAFEDVYRTQTSWLIPDGQLRDDLRISTSLKVIQAYRNFVGRHTNSIGDRHIKYSADDLENYLMDLFEGSQKSLQNSHRR
ncbi:Exocyst complex component EXO70E2 [Linum grandiflorum]